MADDDLLVLDGCPPSAELRADMAREGKPALLAFSRGKDSIAAWLALKDHGIDVRPFYRYGVPGLKFVEDSLAWFENYFGVPILRIPHPSLYRKLSNYTMQPPQRCLAIDVAGIHEIDYRESNALVAKQFGLDPAKTWLCDGVRATDTPQRRRSISVYGPFNAKERTMHIVWDWRQKYLRRRLHDAQIQIPPDYLMYGRSLDGLDYRYMGPLKEHYPEDWARVMRWFPMLAADEIRFAGLLSRRHPKLKAARVMKSWV